MDLGGAAAVATYLMGFGDEFEAQNVRSISKLIRASYTLSLPVFVDIRPIGPGVSEINFEDSIKLGVSFMMEAGADALIVPDCNHDTLKTLGNWSTIPVIIRIDKVLDIKNANKIFESGTKAILFTEKVCDSDQFLKNVEKMKIAMKSESK